MSSRSRAPLYVYTKDETLRLEAVQTLDGPMEHADGGGRGRGGLQAINFMFGTLEIKAPTSRRCRKVSGRVMMNRPPLEQRAPFTLDQVRALEVLQTNLESHEQKLGLGYLLCEGICLLEMTSMKSKTNLVGGRRILAPLVGLGRDCRALSLAGTN
eukprot:1873595-Amphidinium_carterae.2